MKNLIEHDSKGNWKLKGVSWQQLREGAVITKSALEEENQLLNGTHELYVRRDKD